MKKEALMFRLLFITILLLGIITANAQSCPEHDRVSQMDNSQSEQMSRLDGSRYPRHRKKRVRRAKARKMNGVGKIRERKQQQVASKGGS